MSTKTLHQEINLFSRDSLLTNLVSTTDLTQATRLMSAPSSFHQLWMKTLVSSEIRQGSTKVSHRHLVKESASDFVNAFLVEFLTVTYKIFSEIARPFYLFLSL